MFTDQSRRTLNHKVRNLSEPLPVLLTLTYPLEFPADGRKVKRDWRCMRKWLTRRGRGGLMVVEFQERGAPHLHVYINGRVDKDAVREAWWEIVGSGDANHRKAGTRVEKLRQGHAMLMYVQKYISKQQQKQVPEGYENVGRFWSLFGGVQVTPEQVLHGTRESLAPVVRVVRNLVNSRRRSKGVRLRRGRGHCGFSAWDTGPPMIDYLKRLGCEGGGT
jgi:hypothetical protein